MLRVKILGLNLYIEAVALTWFYSGKVINRKTAYHRCPGE